MKKTVRWLGTLAIGAALHGGLAGFALAQGPAVTSAGPPPVGDEGGNIGLPVVTSPTEAEPGTELPVLYVTSIEVMRTQTQPQLDIVRVTGLVGSQGWSSPELVPTYVGKPLDGILDLQLIATMPLQTEPATGFVPINAVFPLEEGHAFRGVRVRGSENAIEVDQIPRRPGDADHAQRLPGLHRQKIRRARAGRTRNTGCRAAGGSSQNPALDSAKSRNSRHHP